MVKRKRGGRRTGKRRTRHTSAKMTLQQREERVKTALQHGHDKEAIVHLKQMLKQERRPEWEGWAVEAHQRQTHRLLQAGKFQEAANLFASGHQLCGLPLDCADYIRCLLQLKQTTKAVERYVSARSFLPKTDLFRLQVELGALALAGDKQILKQLPVNDPVVVDFDKALALLEYWCANDDTVLRQDLKALSFRSPYRDLRTLLSTRFSDDGRVGVDRERLTRISSDSPYQRLAMLFHAASLDNREMLLSLPGLGNEENRFLALLKGWSNAQGKLAGQLAVLPDEPDYASIFRFADRHKSTDEQSMQRMAEMAAIHGSAHRNRAVNLSRFEKRFGRLSPKERAHAEARSVSFAYAHGLLDNNGYELGDYQQVERAWGLCAKSIYEANVDDDARFRNALINRYVSHLWLETGNPANEITARNIEISLQVDPQDKPSHLLLIDYYLAENKLKKARAAVNNALKVYPHDISILLAAIQVAVAGNAFKKAAGYAKQILAVDPINREARRLLYGAHLAHAHKQASVGKWHLVRKEVKEVMRWVDNPRTKATGLILEACCELRAEQATVAADLLNEASVLAGSTMNTCFIIQYEAHTIGFDEADLYSLANIDWPLDALQHKDELFSLIDTVDHFLDEDNTDQIARVLSQFNTVLAPLASLIENEDEFEKLCEFWLRTGQDGLLTSYTDTAKRRFGNKPVFTYFGMVNKPWLDSNEFDALEDAMEEAKEQGDQALAMRMISLLAELPPPGYTNAFRGILGEDAYDDPVAKGIDYDDNKIINLIRTADMDEVLINMESMIGIPHDEIEQIRAIIGEEMLREFFVRAFTGENIESLEDLMPKGNRPPKARSKKKKARKKSINTRQLGLFE